MFDIVKTVHVHASYNSQTLLELIIVEDWGKSHKKTNSSCHKIFLRNKMSFANIRYLNTEVSTVFYNSLIVTHYIKN